MQFFRKIAFWKKVLILGAIPLAVMGTVIGMLSYRQSARVVTLSQEKVLADTINRIDININVKARQINAFMHAVAESAPAKQLVCDDGAAFDPAELALFCQNTFGSFAEINDTNVFLRDALVYTDHDPLVPLRPDALEPLYDMAARYHGRIVWSGLMPGLFSESEATRAQMLIYTGIYTPQGDPAGLLVLEVDPAALGGLILTKQKILSQQTTFITDRNGSVIYSDNNIQAPWLEAILGSYAAGARKATLELDGSSFYVCSQYNALTSWITHTVILKERLFPDAATLRSYIVMLVFTSVMLASGFLMILALAVTKPLARLNAGMKEAQDKNFELQLQNDRGDEIGELTESFNSMVNRINILVNQVYQEKLAQKNAELEALQMQINPHFLYNTLDCINWMLIDRDDMDISAVVVALGKLMQYSLDTTNAMVTLLEEYANVHDYLMIQKARLEDKLAFKLDLEDGLTGYRVPKLMLQPLVENAIRHGIEPSSARCMISVQSRRDGDMVCICVKDDGVGMDAAQLAHYKTLLRHDSASHTNVGVHNVMRRLELHFGENCSFDVESAAGAGLCLTIRVPVIR